MKKHIPILGCLAILALSGVIAVRANAQDGKPIDKLPTSKVVWEYKVLIPNETGPDKHEQRRSNLEIQLAEVGQDGWELIESPYMKGIRYQMLIFKRPKAY